MAFFPPPSNFISQDLFFLFFLLGPFAYIFNIPAFSPVDSGAAQTHLHLCNKTGNGQGERTAYTDRGLGTKIGECEGPGKNVSAAHPS